MAKTHLTRRCVRMGSFARMETLQESGVAQATVGLDGWVAGVCGGRALERPDSGVAGRGPEALGGSTRLLRSGPNRHHL